MRESVTVTMLRNKETKNAVRVEATEDDVTPDNLYVRKGALRDMGDPQTITVTVTPAD